MYNTESKIFIKKLIVIGVPVVFQNLISIGLNLIDTLMIGMIGERELAAVGAANQVFFIFSIALFGLYSGAAVFTAQYWGAKDIKGIRRMLGMDYLVAIGFSVFITIIAFAFASNIIGIFSSDNAVIRLGMDYLRIACLSYIFSGISMAVSYNSRAIQNLKVPTIINAIALGINAVLNYMLIFGMGVFPEMGVKGAAIATLIARIIEFSLLFAYIYTRKEHPFKTGIKELFGFSGKQFSQVMRLAIPVVFTEGSWAISVSLIFAAYGHLGTAALAVTQVANVVTDMMQSIYFGVGNATAMLIGEVLGQGDKDCAYRNGRRAIKVICVLNIIMTIILFLLSNPIANVYNFNTKTTELLVKTLMMMALAITPRMLGYIFIVGILRAGGDTVFCMKLEIFCNMVVQVPVAFVAVMVLHTSLPIAIILGEIGNLIRILVCWPRFHSCKWINIVTS